MRCTQRAVCLIGGLGLLQLAPVVLAQDPPDSIFLNGIVRDFQETHPDFEEARIVYKSGPPGVSDPPNTWREYDIRLVLPDIGPDLKPVLNWNGSEVDGRVLLVPYQDGDGNYIAPQVFERHPDPDDVQGIITEDAHVAAAGYLPMQSNITSPATFDDWFNDRLGVNLSMWLVLEAHLQPGGTYIFDSAVDEPYATLGGFFPLEGRGYGSAPPDHYQPGSPPRNFHFTFEAHWHFLYDDTVNQYFTFAGDDDVWVFVNGEQVIDLGGTHNPRSQTIDMSRLGLTPGDPYRMDFLYAERHCCGSNLRIETNIELIPGPPGPMSIPFD